MPAYVLKEMTGSIGVAGNDRKAEISLPHVFAQCAKRLINYKLVGNAGSLLRGSLLRLRKRRAGFTFMCRKSERKTVGGLWMRPCCR